jgi:opacity protein-like surface antigen
MFSFVSVGFAQDGRKTQKGNGVQNGINKYRGEMGVSSVGGIIGYGIDRKTALAGIDYRYNIRDRIRLAPSILYVLENEEKSIFCANVDAHYLARVTDKITIYPIGGLGMSVWNFRSLENQHPLVPETDDLEVRDSETRDSETNDSGASDPETSDSETKIRMGLNLGFGGEMRVTKDIIIGAEFRYNLTSERIYDQAMLVARVAYYF